MIKISKDNRDNTLQCLESEIQSNAYSKDKTFVLKGKWKRFVRREQGYKIYSVDIKWIKMNLCVYFGHGGHGLVHEFIPLDEIWITSHHYNKGKDKLFNCLCKTKSKDQKVSNNYFESTIIHEIVECEEMKKGKSYWKSHLIALEKEKEAGLLSDPFNDML